MSHFTGNHSPQPFPWGCLHHSLHALTGNDEILQDTTECGVDRFLFQASQRWGYYFKALWADDSHEQIAGPDWWQRVVAERYMYAHNSDVPAGPPVSGLALVGIKSRKYQGLDHCVAVLVRPGKGLPVVVFDPGEPTAFEFKTLEAFAESPYGWAKSVTQVVLGDLANFPSHHGPSMRHVTEADRERWLQTKLPPTQEPSHTAV